MWAVDCPRSSRLELDGIAVALLDCCVSSLAMLAGDARWRCSLAMLAGISSIESIIASV
jgi:hypothetical protein